MWVRMNAIGDAPPPPPPAEYETATGNPASFVTVRSAPLKTLTAAFTPVQSGSGDPAPDNVRPFVGWTGADIYVGSKNLFGGVYGTKWVLPTPLVIRAGETLTISTSVVASNPRINVYTGNGGATRYWNAGINTTENNRKVRTKTFTEDIVITAFLIDYAECTDIQIEWGNTATEYSAYAPITTASVPFGASYYGGTLDVLTGEMTVTHVAVTADGVNIKANRAYTGANAAADLFGAGIVYVSPSGLAANSNLTPPTNIWCDTLPVKSPYLSDGNFQLYCPVSGSLYVVFYVGKASEHPEITTNQQKIDFTNSWLQSHPTTFAYELANPQTVQLTPAQVSAIAGDNAVWSNLNGDLAAEYRSN